MLPLVHCVKTAVSCIFSSFLIVYWEEGKSGTSYSLMARSGVPKPSIN